jgi:hypothetical protein
MSRARIDVRELAASGGSGVFGAKLDAQAPLAARPEASPVTTGKSPSRSSWWAHGLRVVRNAAIAVAVMSTVPVGLVAFGGDWLSRTLANNSMRATRTAAAERVRPFRVPADPSITPLQAGVALNALQPIRLKVPGFEAIEPGTRAVDTWRTVTLASDMFATARPDLYGGPSSRTVLEASVKGFTPREMEYLRALAAAPIWRQFDLVARAPSVDVIGGQFRTPFGTEARPEQRPLPAFRDSRDLAYAAVARAAYYMAIGEPERAETVLRSVVSYGFSFIDNGTSGLEQLIGVMIVGTGRDALQRFYVIQHDPRASLPALASPRRAFDASTSQASKLLSAEDARRRLLLRIEDPAVPLGERYEGLQSLSATSCTNVRELLLGPRADVREVLDRARRTVARYPSEEALVDLQTRLLAPSSNAPSSNPIQSLAVSSATVAGVVLHNPRLVSCTRLLTGGW